MLFNEPKLLKYSEGGRYAAGLGVSVLFNEPKLLKCSASQPHAVLRGRFSALQRAEIAEIVVAEHRYGDWEAFQCSSTSRNC